MITKSIIKSSAAFFVTAIFVGLSGIQTAAAAQDSRSDWLQHQLQMTDGSAQARLCNQKGLGYQASTTSRPRLRTIYARAPDADAWIMRELRETDGSPG